MCRLRVCYMTEFLKLYFMRQDSFNLSLFIILFFTSCNLDESKQVHMYVYAIAKLTVYFSVRCIDLQKQHSHSTRKRYKCVFKCVHIIIYKWHTSMYTEENNYMHLSKRLTIWTYVQILNSCLQIHASHITYMWANMNLTK